MRLRSVSLLVAAAVTLALAACGAASSTDSGDAGGDASIEALAAAAPTDSVPAELRGTWDESAEACGDPPGESRLVVEAERLRFHESVAQVESVQPGIEGAVQLQLAFEGEGESWREPRTLRLLPDRSLAVQGPLITDTRVRCG